METLLDSLVVAVRADTRALGQGLDQVRQDLGAITTLSGVLGEAGELAADRMSRAFERFARTGKLSFADLKASVLSAMNDIASSVIQSGIEQLLGGGGGGGGNLLGSLGALFGQRSNGLLSLAGRAAGGPVSEGRPFVVGERGPELFIPDRAGRITPDIEGARAQRAAVNITVNVNGAGDAPSIRQSAGQVALAVRRAMARAERDL